MKEMFFLFFYSILKAFLPLPSLEVVLLPLAILNPDFIWNYALIGSIGTMIGGSIGYFLALLIEEKVWIHIIGDKTWKKGKELVNKYGVYAVFIGGITPIPDFILSYIAGVTRMSFIKFILSDGIARLIRSILILFLFIQLGILIDIDKYGMYFLYAFIIYFVGKYLYNILKSRII